jgi:uncharacterized membrane protein YhaH (DUF805 family)
MKRLRDIENHRTYALLAGMAVMLFVEGDAEAYIVGVVILYCMGNALWCMGEGLKLISEISNEIKE